ncbi:hypothetical protein HNR39_000806 [Glaciimonas immobilis]|uniref:Uncharacterized protein n=1 Tax=Glaciimonas immobilis TaxID=728004 RepID=A0A840RPR3_9BURK|nr:hypothetical protein [Glaciimonas immobilis]
MKIEIRLTQERLPTMEELNSWIVPFEAITDDGI